MKKLLLIATLLLTTIAQATAQETDKTTSEVIATAGDIQITHEQLLQYLPLLPPEVQTANDPTTMQRIIDILIQRALLEKQAIKEKIHEQEKVKILIKIAQQTVLADYYLEQIIRKSITENDIKKAYEEYAKATPDQPQFKARHILLKSKKEAINIITKIENGEDFATLAKAHSTGPSAPQGGDLGYFNLNKMVPEFAETVAKLKIGEYSKTPTKTQFGWHIILVEDKRNNAPLPLEEIKRQLGQALALTKIEETLRELTAKVDIKYKRLDNLNPQK